MCSWHEDLAHRMEDPQGRAAGFQREAGGGSREDDGERAETPAEREAPPAAAELGRAALRPASFFEIFDGTIDEIAIDPALLLGVAEEQAVIADDVDEPGDAARVSGDPIQRGL